MVTLNANALDLVLRIQRSKGKNEWDCWLALWRMQASPLAALQSIMGKDTPTERRLYFLLAALESHKIRPGEALLEGCWKWLVAGQGIEREREEASWLLLHGLEAIHAEATGTGRYAIVADALRGDGNAVDATRLLGFLYLGVRTPDLTKSQATALLRMAGCSAIKCTMGGYDA